jgi:hypothetical protein
MRLFQNSGLMSSYRLRLQNLTAETTIFADMRDAFLVDRYGASHILKPIHDQDASAFFTNGDDEDLQRAWAREKGMKADMPLTDILLAQIEEHRTEVFYNLDPVRYASDFVRCLPGSVKCKIAWRAAPSGSTDFTAYDLMVCNFPSILEGYRNAGLRAEWFFPAHDPELDAYAENSDRPVDIAFIGTYSRHHSRRAALIEAVASLVDRYRVALHLDSGSQFQKLADSPLGLVGPLRKHRRPAAVRAASQPPVFGRDLYKTLSSAKIIINGAVDMAGPDRGNMRCFEAMGARACLVSDAGNYPKGMEDGKTARFYDTPQDAARVVRNLIETGADRAIAAAGHDMMRSVYSKERQWARFQELAS